MRGPAVLFLMLQVGATGCASVEPAPSAPAALVRQLDIVLTPVDGALASDAAPLFFVTLRDPSSGERRLAGHYLGALPFDGAVVALAADGALRRFATPSGASEAGEGEPLAAHVTAIPVVSADGAHLAYPVSEDGLTGALHVLDAMGERVVTSPLGSVGALAFSPDGARVAFVGVAERGGIAGVWVADARGVDPVRCLTNCALGPGELDLATPLPAGELHVEHQRITWIDQDGVAHEVTP